MSGLVRSAFESYRRWRSEHPDANPPDVRVRLTDGAEFIFRGLAIPPTNEDPDIVTIAGAGQYVPSLVVRDSDVTLVEIGPTDQPPFGFNR